MYASFFGLRCLPFEDRADPQFFFTSSEGEEALAAMEYEAHYGEGLGLVLGASGTGKTLLIRTLLPRLNSSDRAVIITWPANGAMDLVRECCKGFGVTVGSSHNPARRLSRLRRHLQRAVASDQQPILILDQAENLAPENMAELATLGDLQGDQGKLLTIILVGQPQFRSLIDKPDFSRLKQRLFGERTLTPLPLAETQEYIRHRLQVAGVADADLFGVQAIARIHDASGGIPRLINHICNAVMVAAYGAETTQISDVLVEEVTRRSTHTVRTMDARNVGVEHAGQVASGWPEALAHHGAAVGGRESVTGSCGTVSGATVSAGVDNGRGAANPGCGHSGALATMRDPTGTGDEPLSGPPAFGGGGLVEGEMLYERLEQSLARADRVSTSTEATLAQFTAVEKYLASLLDRAERIVGTLQPSIQQGTQVLDETQARLAQIIGDAEHGAAAVETRIRHTAELMADGGEQAKRIEQARADAESVESRLTSLADRIADKADEVQGHVTTLMKNVEVSESARAELGSLVDRAATVTANADVRVDALREKLRQSFDECDRSGNETVESLRSKLGDIAAQVASSVVEAEGRMQALTGKLESAAESTARFEKEVIDSTVERVRRELSEHVEILVRSQKEALDEAVADAAARVQASVDSAVGQVDQARRKLGEDQCALQETLESATADSFKRLRDSIRKAEQGVEETHAQFEEKQCSLQENLERAIASSSGRIEALTRAARERTEELGQQVAGAERRNDEVRASLTHLTAGTDEAAGRLGELQDSLRGVHSSVVELTERSESITEPLASNLDRGETMIREVRTACEEMKTLQNLVAAGLVDVGMGCEKVAAARQQAEECERITSGLTHDATAGRELAQELSELVTSADDLAKTIDEKVDEAREGVRTLDTQRASVDGVLRRLEEVATTGHTVIDRATAATLAAEQAAREAQDQAERLSQTETSSGKAAEHLGGIVESAGQVNEALTGLVAHADEKIARISSHHAAASQIVDRLAKANVTASEAVERLETTREAAEQEVEAANTSIDQLLLEASSITEKTEQNCRELSERNAEAVELLDRLDGATEPASKITADLNKSMEEANGVATRIAEDCEKASSLAERLNTVSRVLSAAKTIGASVQRTVDQAKELSGQLQGDTDRAGKQCSALRDLGENSRTIVETHRQIASETEEAVERFAEQLSIAEAGEQLVTELMGQTESLGREVYELQRRATQAEARFTEVASVPNDMVENAQAQAAQLEQVCAAVRRVFAGLSKASLEAKRQTDQLQGAGAEATGRLAQLTSETNRASRTLNQWVQVAIEASSRLEQTLGECPSTGDTRPSDALGGVARTVRPFAHVANPSAGGELTMLSHPGEDVTAGGGTAADGEDSTIAKPTTRAEEISRLIKEAKQAGKAATRAEGTTTAKAVPAAQS